MEPVVVFPDPEIARNVLPSSYGRWSEPRGVWREREVIGGHPGQVGSLRGPRVEVGFRRIGMEKMCQNIVIYTDSIYI